MPPNLKAGDFLTRAFKHHACGTRAIRALCPRSRGHENAPVGISTGRRRGAHGRRALRRRCRGCQPGGRGPNGCGRGSPSLNAAAVPEPPRRPRLTEPRRRAGRSGRRGGSGAVPRCRAQGLPARSSAHGFFQGVEQPAYQGQHPVRVRVPLERGGKRLGYPGGPEGFEAARGGGEGGGGGDAGGLSRF